MEGTAHDWILRTHDGRAARSLWTLAANRAHLNHGSYGGITQSTADAQRQLLDEMQSAPGQWFASLPERLRGGCHALASALGLKGVAIAPTVNASGAATVAFRGLRLRAGSVAIVNNHSYGAVVHALRHSQPSVQVRVLEVPLATTDDEIVDLYASALDRDVSVVLLDQFASATAKAFPVERLIPLIRGIGAVSVVDGAHAPGILATPLPTPTPDVWFGNLHKHLCGPLASALIAVRDDLDADVWPLIDSWNEGQPFPDRFYTQGAVDFTAFLTARHAHDEIEAEFGWDAVRAHATSLTSEAHKLLAEAITEQWGTDPMLDIPNPTPHFALLQLPKWPGPQKDRSAELRALMSREAGIEAMAVGWEGHHYLRLCSHAYNTLDDYQALAATGIAALNRHWRAEK